MGKKNKGRWLSALLIVCMIFTSISPPSKVQAAETPTDKLDL